jgi:hypothetical protein
MPKNKLIQFAVIGALLLLIIFSRLSGSGERIPALQTWEGSPTRIEIRLPGESVSLYYRDNSWVLGEEAFPADAGKITRMADALNMLRIEELVSRRGDLERYELDEERSIEVEAYDGEKLLRSIRIGKETERGIGAYITVNGRSGIFLAGENLRAIFETTADDLRNRQILALNPADIIAVTVRGPEGSYSIRRSADNDEAWRIPEAGDEAVDPEQVQQFMGQLARISAVEFAGSPAAAGSDPRWSFSIQDQNNFYDLNIFGPAADNENAFLSTSSHIGEAFTISAYKAEQLMRNLSWFGKQ